MFQKYKCNPNKDSLRSNQRGESYFRNLVTDQELRVRELRAQELLATAENPRIKFQEVTTDICRELRDYKKKEFLEDKRRQQLRTNTYDLRTLQTQLQAALVSQQLAEQNKVLAEQREKEIQRKNEEDAKWREECAKAKKSLHEEEEREWEKKLKFRHELTLQMNENEMLRRKKIEAVMKDRENMQKTMNHIRDLELAEWNKKMQSLNKFRRDMEECVRNIEIQREIEKEQCADDSERLLEFQRERDEMKRQRQANRKKQQAHKMALSERIGNELVIINKETKKREELLLSLLIEERNAKEDEKFRQKLDQQQKDRSQLRAEMEKYRNEILVQKARMIKEEETQMYEAQMRTLAENDKLDQMSAEKKRRKVMEHNRALRDMIEYRRQQHAKDIADTIAGYQMAMQAEKESDQRVEEERIRMLQAAPPELLRYLSPGVLRPSDREFLSW